jgi:hypothetical protein
MREWFIVGSKLLGIYFLYLALSTLPPYIVMAMSSFSSSIILNEGPSNLKILLASISSGFVMIAFAIVLLFKNDWIADILKITAQMHESKNQLKASNLHTGITLIGIYIFCTRSGALFRAYAESRRVDRMFSPFLATQPEGLPFSPSFVEPVATLLISLLLIFGSRHIAAFLTKNKLTATGSDKGQ